MASLYMSFDLFISSFLENKAFITSSENYSSLDFSNIELSSIIFQGFNLKAQNFRQTLAFVLFIDPFNNNSLNLVLEAFSLKAFNLNLKNYLIVFFDLSTSTTKPLIYIKEFNKEINKLKDINLLEGFKAIAKLEGYLFKSNFQSKLNISII